jgi:hypothetical protein
MKMDLLRRVNNKSLIQCSIQTIEIRVLKEISISLEMKGDQDLTCWCQTKELVEVKVEA